MAFIVFTSLLKIDRAECYAGAADVTFPEDKACRAPRCDALQGPAAGGKDLHCRGLALEQHLTDGLHGRLRPHRSARRLVDAGRRNACAWLQNATRKLLN
jgi:hypothetical protein